MRGKRLSSRPSVLVAVLTVAGSVTSTWAAPREKVLYSFNGKEGYYPYAGLILDPSGTFLYGMTYEGGYGCGGSGCGTVFGLTLAADLRWREKLLHTFNNDDASYGFDPQSGLIFDAAGNLYGTTYYGGAHGYGTVFELMPTVSGGWTEKVLHSFTKNGKDGYYPGANLVFDASGNLYGTTNLGGFYTVGTVFELTPNDDGSWREKVLHSFNNNFDFTGRDGFYPEAGLVFNASGYLYGTTLYGGVYGDGTVFELRPNEDGDWTEKVLHSFNTNGKDGYYPYAGLVSDTAGNLYGTTYAGGAYDEGTVFQLTATSGAWAERLLHSFSARGKDGYNPYAGLIFDAAGNLYGTTLNGGAHNSGTVFELMPAAGEHWTEKVLHHFAHDGKDGINPYAGLIFDAAGNLYGTTFAGGAYDEGTVFELTP